MEDAFIEIEGDWDQFFAQWQAEHAQEMCCSDEAMQPVASIANEQFVCVAFPNPMMMSYTAIYAMALAAARKALSTVQPFKVSAQDMPAHTWN